MKKYLYILFATCLFASCNTDNLIDEPWGDISSEFEETNLSFADVMSSADYWVTSHYDVYHYTEPNGKGECYSYECIPSGGSFGSVALLVDNLRFYHNNTTAPGLLPGYYIDKPCRIEGDKILFHSWVHTSFYPVTHEERECYYKILDYDESNILVETNSLFTERDGVKYPYAIVHYRKWTHKDPNWRDNYVTLDELHRIEKELDEFMQNGGNINDFKY